MSVNTNVPSSLENPSVNLLEVLPEARVTGPAGDSNDLRIRHCTTDPTGLSSESALVLIPGTEPTPVVFQGRFRFESLDSSDSDSSDGKSSRPPQGDHRDSHSSGPRGAIISMEPIPHSTVPVLIVPDPVLAYGRICHALAGHPTRQLQVVGVLGSRSASGVSALMAGMLQAAGRPFGVLSSYGCMDGRDMMSSRSPRQSVEGMVHWLRCCVQQGCTHAIMEITPAMLASGVTAGCRFSAVCVGDRIGRPSGVSESVHFQNILRLFHQTDSHRGFAVFNADAPAAVRIMEQIATPSLTIGVSRSADMTAQILEQTSAEQTFLMQAGSDVIPVRTRQIGHRVVSDSLMVAATGLGWELPLPTIVRGLESIDAIPGHHERVVCGQEFGVYVESRRSIATLRETLSTLRDTTSRRILCVIDAETQLSQPRRIQWIEALAEFADRIILTSAHCATFGMVRKMDESTLTQTLESIRRAFPNPSQVQVVVRRDRAVATALRKAERGDMVLLAGGRRTTDPRTYLPTDDAELAKQWLRSAHRKR